MAEKFWTDSTAEPKRAYRWTVLLGTDRNNLAHFVAKKVTKPSFTVTETAHSYLNHKFYYPGRLEWNTVTLTLADAIFPNSAEVVRNMLEDSGYQLPDRGNYGTIGKAKSVGALGVVQITQHDSEGKAGEHWKLHNAWIKDAKFGDLDYESDDMLEVELEIRYDYAELVQA